MHGQVHRLPVNENPIQAGAGDNETTPTAKSRFRQASAGTPATEKARRAPRSDTQEPTAKAATYA